jgi:hypothetical protein
LPVPTLAETNLHRVRIVCALVVTWSLLQCALLFVLYWIHRNPAIAYLLEIIPCLPVFALIALIARFRASKPEAVPRPYLNGMFAGAGALLASGALAIIMDVLFPPTSLPFVGLLAAFPMVLGILPTYVFLLPKRALAVDPLSPIRLKLATPSLRRVVRLGALIVVYLTCRLASRMVFYQYGAKGILAYALALLPVLPIFGLIPIYNKYMEEEQDEFQRHLFHQSVLWAFLGTLIVACAIGQLKDYALLFSRSSDLFPPYMLVLLFYFLQIEAGYVIAAIHAARLKRNP